MRDRTAVWLLILTIGVFAQWVNLMITWLVWWITGWNFVAILISVMYIGEKANEMVKQNKEAEREAD